MVYLSIANVDQVRVQRFLEKTKKSRRKATAAESQEELTNEMLILRKRVKSLIRRNRVAEAQKLVKSEKFKAWGRDTQAKVCNPEG